MKITDTSNNKSAINIWQSMSVISTEYSPRNVLNKISNFFFTNTELSFAILSGVFWTIGMLLSLTKDALVFEYKLVFFIGILFGAYYTTKDALEDFFSLKFDIDFLMLFAAVGAMFLGKWGDAGLLLFLFSLGHALEHFAMRRAKKSITALMDLVPHTALLIQADGIKEINIDDLRIGEKIVIKPNSKIPIDGIVTNGNSTVDQSPITGESIPKGKRAYREVTSETNFQYVPEEHKVFAGTLNGNGALEIIVSKLSKDSSLSRLINLVKEAESQKSPTQHFAESFEKYYVPIVLISVILLAFAFLVLDETYQESFYRAMSVLIAASPCALAISTPSAVLAAIARAARQGVLIKGGKPLEDLGKVEAIAFDKTGTLTEGRPKLTHVIPFNSTTELELMQLASAVEQLSDHPLARAIVEGCKQRNPAIIIPLADQIQALIARGVTAIVKQQRVYIGNRKLFQELTKSDIPIGLEETMSKLETEGNTVMIVYREGKYLGLIAVMDLARAEAKSTIQELKNLGISNLLMLTGDNQKVANAVAKELAIENPKAELLPEDKVYFLNSLLEDEIKVAMIGDGVNDAPAMAKSTVSIAMGAAGSDVALETADIALMADKLDNLPFAISLSKKANRIIKQNLIISLGMVLILVPLTLFGIAKIGLAVVGHEGSTILVVMNALRLLRFKHT